MKYLALFYLFATCASFLLPSALNNILKTESYKIAAFGITPNGNNGDMSDYRGTLNKQMKPEDSEEFDGYKLCDLIVNKWGMPYDLQLKKEVFAGKPMLYLNVMWKYLGQESFHLTEREYLEHLEAIAQLLIKWEKVQHVKDLIKTCRKRPKAYFGYAVGLPLELPPDTIIPIFPEKF
mmetsp:Transcript_7626/g.11443  ORF Transcript_7626/g.11443 Transcript_7626/m.11443 type:complete len:178 (+) Transcript_7626:44-577(+)